MFVSNAASKDEVKEKMYTSFGQAYKDGKWKLSKSLIQERVIGLSCLPEALGQTLVPTETQRCFEEAVNPQGKAMGRDEATIFVAKTVATDLSESILEGMSFALFCPFGAWLPIDSFATFSYSKMFRGR
ncbi:unnamed protein product [Choristocarpus tenellus]